VKRENKIKSTVNDLNIIPLLKEVGEELAKMKVSFPRGETLKKE